MTTDQSTALKLLGYVPNSENLRTSEAVSHMSTGDPPSVFTLFALMDDLRHTTILLDTLVIQLKKQMANSIKPSTLVNPSLAHTFEQSTLQNVSAVQLVDELLRRLNSDELMIGHQTLTAIRQLKLLLENR